MTTLVRPDAPTDDGGGGGAAPSRPHEPSRYAAWRSSWAVALRMARRDVRRHQGRSALIVVMVAVPTLLLSLVMTLSMSEDIDSVESIPFRMGSGQALVEGPDTARFVQGADPDHGSVTVAGNALTVPGVDPETDAFGNAGAIARLVGAPVDPVASFSGRTTIGERRITVDGIAVGGPQGLADKFRLVSGRWPQGASQAVVTEYGRFRGLPDGGRLTVSLDGAEHTFDIVGVAAPTSRYSSEGLAVAEPPTEVQGGGGQWIVRGAEPVSWEDVQRLNEYGLRVASRQVLLDPPPVDDLPAEIRDYAVGDANQVNLVVGLGAAMLLIITALLVGPAFAVSATRQRRTLALAASNGASTPVLRRTVLAQALVLGGASALVGTALGVLATPVVMNLVRSEGDFAPTPPLDVRWGLLAGIAVCAVGSTLVAALAPARRLGRLDIVGVMRGQSISPRPSPLVLAAGVVLTVVGALAVLGSTGAGGLPSVTELLGLEAGDEFAVTIGAVVLILGTLFLVPVILAGVGRFGGHLPTTLRMAARDLARHRARSAPSVAAVLAAVAGLTFGLTGLASDTEQSRREYLPATLMGEADIDVWGEAPPIEALRAAAPGLVVTENLALDPQDPTMTEARTMPSEPYRVGFLTIVPPGCTVPRTVQDDAWFVAEQARYLAAEAAGTLDDFVERPSPCLAGGAAQSNSGQVLLLPVDEIVRRLGLDEAQSDAVRSGAVVTRDLPVASLHGSMVTIARGTSLVDPTATGPTDPQVEVLQEVDLPVVEMPRSPDLEGRMLNASMILALGTEVTTGWPTHTVSLGVRDPSGAAVTDAAAEKLQQALGDEVQVDVERGFSRDDEVIVAALLGVFALLILVITLTSTALTLAEQQTDQATLAALGATRGTRRLMAGAAAFLLAAVGCVLGVAVGLVPGIAIARPLTSNGWSADGLPAGGSSVLVIPWLSLLVVGVLVPLVAGAIAWAGIRKAPQITRRAT